MPSLNVSDSIPDAILQIDGGNQAYFNLRIVENELRFVVATPDLSINHDCGVFEAFPDFLYLKYSLQCSDGESTDITVKAIFRRLQLINLGSY